MGLGGGMMRMKFKIIFLLVPLLMISLTGCQSEKLAEITDARVPKYEIYSECGGNLSYTRIYSMEKNKIDFKNVFLPTKKELRICIDSFSNGPNYKVYCAMYSNYPEKGLSRYYAIFKDGKFQKKVDLGEKQTGTSDLMSDTEKGITYITGALQPAGTNPNGRPYKVLKNDQIINNFGIKGAIRSYTIGEKVIYANVVSKSYGYEDMPEEFLSTIDRDTQEVKVLNTISVGSLAFNSKNRKLYGAISDSNNETPRLCVLDANGKLEKEFFPVPYLSYGIYIDKNGLAYLGTDYGAKVFDTNTEKVVKEINIGSHPSDYFASDNYLFISSESKGSVAIIDMNTQELIGTLKVAEPNSLLGRITVVKRQ